MPEIDRERLAAKLEAMPAEHREPYLKELRASGYTWATSAKPTAEGPSLRSQILEVARKQGPQAVGGAIGSTLGTPFGPPGRIAGAAIGGGGGKAAQMIGEYIAGSRDPLEDTMAGNAREIGLAALAEGGTEGAFAGLGALKPLGAKLGGGGAKIGAAVPEKYGEAAFKDPSILNRAFPKKVTGEAYDAFERYTGLKGLERHLVEGGRATAPTGELEQLVIGTANRVARGEKVPAQDLYLASQAASRLKLMAKYGEPQAQMAAASGAVTQGKQMAEGALEKMYPEYGTLRKQHFEAKAREAFSHLLPQNKGGTTNVLRPLVAMAASGGASTVAGLPGLAGLAAVSPKAWGALIRMLPSLGKGARGATRLGAAAAADELARPEEELP